MAAVTICSDFGAPQNSITYVYMSTRVSLVVKNLPTMQETQVPSLGGEDPLEKKMATHCIILSWKIPWTEELGRLQSMGSQKSQTQLSD